MGWNGYDMSRVDEIIDSCTTVVMAPSPAIGHILDLIGKNNYQRSDLESVIRSDGLLTSEVLRIANSTNYRGQNVNDIGLALMRLGEKELFRIAVRASATCMQVEEVDGYGMPGGGLWLNGLRIAVAAEILANYCPGVEQGVAYTAGLLLDVGKRILGVGLQPCIEEALEASQTANFDEVERSLLGCTHAEIGARLMVRWKLPSSLSSALRWHHTPVAAESHEALVWVCHVADFLALNLGGGGGSVEGFGYTLEMGWQSHLQISEVEMLSFLPIIHDEVERIQASVTNAQ